MQHSKISSHLPTLTIHAQTNVLCDYAINNAYLFYKHSCHAHKLSAKDLLSFRLELVHLLLEQTGPKGVVRARKVARDAAQSTRVCEL